MIMSVFFVCPSQASSFITNYTRDNGLPQTTITSIVEDDLGYLLFGTQDGLTRFDGYKFKVLRHDNADPESLASNSVNSLHQGPLGKIWIGTNGGLNTYASSTGKLQRLFPEFTHAIAAMAITGDGQVWIATKNNGLFTTKAPYRQIMVVKTVPAMPLQATSLAWSTSGSLWVGSLQDGLFRYDAKQNTVKHFVKNGLNEFNISSNAISSLVIQNDALWVGYRSNSGFDMFDLSSGQLNEDIRPAVVKALGKDRVEAFLHDSSGRMWIGSYSGNGVVRWDRANGTVRQFRASAIADSMRNDKIRVVYEDSTGSVWLGTAAGLSKLDQNKERFGHISYGPDINGLHERVVTAVFEDAQQRLWVGTFGGGLHLYDDNSGLLTAIGAEQSIPGSLTNDEVIALSQAPKGKIWVGTIEGLNLYDPKTHHTEAFDQSELFKDSMIFDSRVDNHNRLWIKTNKQLQVYNPQTRSFCLIPDDFGVVTFLFAYKTGMWIISRDFSHVFHQINFSNNQCESLSIQKLSIPGVGKFEPLLLDSKARIWANTPSGLIKISADLQKVEHFTQAQGLPNNTIYGALEDNQGNFWFSTNGGLAKLDPQSNTFTNYTQQDGLQSDEFNGEASLKRANGQLVFAGINGLNVFDPASIKPNQIPPKVQVTSVTVFDNDTTDINVSGSGRKISNGEHIDLTSSQNGFEVEFTGLHFLAPKANRYRYRLIGLDESWSEVGADRRFARYTNLNPGDYQLRVTASNANGVWADKEALVSFFVATPWWMTYWAYFVYVLMSVGFIWGFIRWREQELTRKNLALEQQVNARLVDIRQQKDIIEQQVVELKALDKAKEHFFENISHEFRTPLSLIIGPLKRLYTIDANPAITRKLDAPIRQASRLLRLINQFLEISRLQTGVTQLHRRSYHLSEQIREIARSFTDSIAHKQLRLSLSLDDDLRLDYDALMMEKIVVNLLSNAINYTQSGGRIAIELSTPEVDVVMLKIQDNGIGIAQEQQGSVFERFHKAHNNAEFHHGIGVGLALVKELVELHGGRISLESTPQKGSCFTLTFVSAANDHAPGVLDRLDDLSGACLEQSMFRQHKPADEINKEGFEAGSDTAKWTILIIDDESDMRVYLSELLQDYHLLLAGNGEQGLKIAIEQVPDLIISDVMMPVMDGLALTKAIRVQTTTSHIPIILLTAKGGRDSKLAGLREGVDDYIVKPFDEAELCLRVNNILVIRDELAKNSCDPQTAANKPLPLPECEQQFINDFRAVLQKEYTDPMFALVDMAKGMHLEKRQLQRKLKALLDTSPSEYLRSFRLNKAAQMLIKGQSVSQTLELSGFMAMSHFSRCFKARFGVAPSQYRRHVEQSTSSGDK